MKVILILLAAVLLSCNTSREEKHAQQLDYTRGESDLREILKSKKQTADSLFDISADSLLVYVKISGLEEAVPVLNREFPKNVESAFNILKGKNRKIAMAVEIPFSESVDWLITLSHYFNDDGSTYAFERNARFYNSICSDELAIETATYFYSENLQLIDSVYRLHDQNMKKLMPDSCEFPYDYEFNVWVSIQQYLSDQDLPEYLYLHE